MNILFKKRFSLIFLCSLSCLLFIAPVWAASNPDTANLDLSKYLFYTSNDTGVNPNPEYTTLTIDDTASAEIGKYNNIGTVNFSIVQVTNTVAFEITNKFLALFNNKDTEIKIKIGNITFSFPIKELVPSSYVKKIILADNSGNYNSVNDINKENIKINILFTKPDLAALASAKQYVQKNHLSLINDPFFISIQAQYEDVKADTDRLINGNTLTFDLDKQSSLPKDIKGYVILPDNTVRNLESAVDKNTIYSKYLLGGLYFFAQQGARFKDIENHWAMNDIDYLADKGIIKGISNERFAPSRKITRAEFTSILLRALNLIPSHTKSSFFKDVSPYIWYHDPITTAVAKGIMTGYSNKLFKPAQIITREQMAVALVKGLRSVGKDSNITGRDIDTQLNKFIDGDHVKPWARYYIAAAINMGLLKGNKYRLDLSHSVTRAEVAAAIKRMIDYLNNLATK